MKAITVIEHDDGFTSVAFSGLDDDPSGAVEMLHRGLAKLASLPPTIWLKGASDE